MKLELLPRLNISVDNGKEFAIYNKMTFSNSNGNIISRKKPSLLAYKNNKSLSRKDKKWVLVCFDENEDLILLHDINHSPKRYLSFYRNISNRDAIAYKKYPLISMVGLLVGYAAYHMFKMILKNT